MNRIGTSIFLLISVCFAALAQTGSLSGRWLITEDFFGTPRYMRLQLEQNGSKLKGELSGNKLEGTVTGATVHFIARSEQKDTFEVQGTFNQGMLTATMVAVDGSNRSQPSKFTLTARPAPRRN